MDIEAKCKISAYRLDRAKPLTYQGVIVHQYNAQAVLSILSYCEQVDVGAVTKTVTVKHTAMVDQKLLVARLNEAHLEASLEPFRQAQGIKHGWIPKWNGKLPML